MGTITSNIGIYIPANGEDFYGSSFAAGMQNVDLHDHSGGPNKGVPLSAAGIADGSITAVKFAMDVFVPGGGLTLDGGTNALKLASAILISLGGLGGNGILVNTGGAISATSFTAGDSNIIISNNDGTGGSPTFSLAAIPTVQGINSTGPTLKFRIAGADFAQIQNNGGITSSSRAFNLCPDNTNQAAIYDRCGNTGSITNTNSATIFTIGTDLYQVWMVSAFNFTNAATTANATFMIYVNSNIFPGVITPVKVCGTGIDITDGGSNAVVLVNNSGQTCLFSWTAIRLV